MKKEEILKKMDELKSDYVRIQADLEKVTYVGGDVHHGEIVLGEIEAELRRLRELFESLEKTDGS